MKKVLLLAAGVILASSNVVPGQEAAPPPSALPALPSAAAAMAAENPAAANSPFADGCPTFKYRTWVSADYLLWWVKNAPSNFPLVTTTNSVALAPGGVPPGALGRPDTQVLFGGSNFNYGAFSGGKLTFGTWLDQDNAIGVEASGFFLAQRSINFSAASNAAGTPQYYLPYFNSSAGREGSFTLSEPANGLGANGSINFVSSLQLWGAEANSVINLYQTRTSGVMLLAGFRFMDLTESLGASGSGTFFNAPAQIEQFSMGFNTRNEFYGAQIGARGYWNFGRLSTEVTGKLALGATYQSVNVNGSNTVSGQPAGFTNGTFPGFVYAQPSNIGHESRFGFSVIPQVNLKVGYNITTNLRATVGYDFLYWTNVVRPGDQMDRNVNPSQALGGNLAGPATPARLFQTSDFFANGLTFGLELKF
jgi:hypothetical protein